MLQITAQAATAHQAEDLANAVAASFIGYSNRSSTQTKQSLAGLEQQATQLSNEIADLQQQINTASDLLAAEPTASAAYQHTQQVLVSLQSTQDQYRLQSDVVNSNIVQAKLSSPTSNAGTVLLQAATTDSPALSPADSDTGWSGALCGLALGAFLAIVLGRRDRRLRRRDDIAAAAEVPVLQSLSPQNPQDRQGLAPILQ